MKRSLTLLDRIDVAYDFFLQIRSDKEFVNQCVWNFNQSLKDRQTTKAEL